MAIATVNPTTGSTEMIIEPHSAEEVQDRIAEAAEAARLLRGTRSPSVRSGCSPRRTSWRTRREGLGALITVEMGKPIAQSSAEVHKCVNAMRFYAEHAEDVPGRRAAGGPVAGRCSQALDALRAARHRPGGHAVELPALAGHPVRRPGADGGQRRPAQARIERAAGRALPRHALRAGGFPLGVVPHAADRRLRGRPASWPTRGSRRSTLTGSEPAGRSVAAIAGGPRQEVRAGTRRVGPFHCHALGATSPPRRRPPSRRGSATTASPASPASASSSTPTSTTRSPPHSSQRMSELVGRRPAGRRDPGRAAGHRSPDATSWPSWWRTPVAMGAQVLTGGGVSRGPRLVLCPHRARRAHRRDADRPGGDLRAGRIAVPCAGS